MSEASAVNGTSNSTCKPAIDPLTFGLGCLGSALAIIVFLSCLKRRNKLKLEYCHGYPGLVIPVNFLHSFSYSNRFTIAATFGATASSCLELFLFSANGEFTPTGVSVWFGVFLKIIGVLVYGVLFYPFFACLTTEYKLLGSTLGFLYAAIRFCFKLGIYFQCASYYKGENRNSFYINFLRGLPTILCLLFITLRFAVLLILEVRRKWFLAINGYQERTVETSEMCLAAEPVIKHVKQILTPGLNRDATDAKWYIKLLHYIYKPREDFKFSTQLVSTVVVAAITVFQLSVAVLYNLDNEKTKDGTPIAYRLDVMFSSFDLYECTFLEYKKTKDRPLVVHRPDVLDLLFDLSGCIILEYKKTKDRPLIAHRPDVKGLLFNLSGCIILEYKKTKDRPLIAHRPDVKDLLFDLYGMGQGAFVLSAMISAILLLHFMKSHRDHVLQLYRGQRRFAQGVFPSPAKLAGESLRFSAYQVASTIYGYFSVGILLWLVLFGPVFYFKHAEHVLPKPWYEWLKKKVESAMYALIIAAALHLFQLFLSHCVFRDRDFPRIVITVDNRRLFSIMSYFLFFFNILVGLISGFLRIIFGMVLGVVFLARIDRSTLMQGFQRFDRAFVAYLGFINLLVAQSHPVMLLFCQLLINRDKVHQPNSESPAGAQSENRDCSKETGVASVYTRERRLPRMSQKAFNRWHLTMTLLRNPCLIKYRKRIGISRATSVRLRSICTDLSELVPA